jgi:hypothetical protein
VPGQLSLKSKGQVFTPYNASIFGLVPGPHDFVVNASEGDHLVTGMEMFHFISDWIEGLVPSPNCTALDDISGAFSCAATKTVSRSCHSSAHTHVVFLVLSNIVDIHLWLSILSIFLNVMFVCAVADLFVAAASVLDNGYSWRSYLHLHYFARLLVAVYSAKGLGGPRTLGTSGELIQHQQEWACGCSQDKDFDDMLHESLLPMDLETGAESFEYFGALPIAWRIRHWRLGGTGYGVVNYKKELWLKEELGR